MKKLLLITLLLCGCGRPIKCDKAKYEQVLMDCLDRAAAKTVGDDNNYVVDSCAIEAKKISCERQYHTRKGWH
jgi:hypothetical protein